MLNKLLQIRAHNLFVPGNWSEPFVINSTLLENGDSNCYKLYHSSSFLAMEQEEMATISTNTKSSKLTRN